MKSNDEILYVKDLLKKFGDFIAVNRINFSVKKGEIFGFLGPNGAGKSTTIKMLSGILKPTGGEGKVAGFDIMNESEQIKKHIGYMSQKFSLFTDLTAEENMNFFAGIYGVSLKEMKKRKDELCDILKLQEKRNELTHLLTGGWRQRLALACALLHSPPIIFLDEPTSGVDPISRRDFWDIIQQLSGQGVTVLVTTHYMEEAEYCQRLALISSGKLIASGSPKELKESFEFKIFNVECDDIIKSLDVLSKDSSFIETSLWGSGLHVVVSGQDDPEGKIKQVLEKEKIAVNSIKPSMVSLEDVFVYKVGEGQKK